MDLTDARQIGNDLAAEIGLVEKLEQFSAQIWTHEHTGMPGLTLDDVSEIPFLVNIDGVEQYQHRARLRAETGDIFAAVTPMESSYEEYCRDHLQLGSPHFLFAEPIDNPLAVAQALLEGSGFGTLVDHARKAGCLGIHPYMSIEPVWELARHLAEAADVPVPVLGPPPPVTWIANDKSLFHDLVNRTIGGEWVVETKRSTCPEDLATALHDLAGRHERVGLKRTRCASAMGNRVLDASRLHLAGPSGARREVDAFLEHTQWPGDEEVLVVAWEETSFSPSTQIWIPPGEDEPPRLDGIYEQILEGPEKVFLGSISSRLPDQVHERLASASLQVAAALQTLGYIGRCSFDFLVVGDPQDPSCRLFFTECNGRWGGTSIPMRLLDRLLTGPLPPYLARDFQHPDLVGIHFEELRQLLSTDLLDPSTGRGRFVLYNVGPLEADGKFDVVSLGRSIEEAKEGVETVLPGRLGLSV